MCLSNIPHQETGLCQRPHWRGKNPQGNPRRESKGSQEDLIIISKRAQNGNSCRKEKKKGIFRPSLLQGGFCKTAREEKKNQNTGTSHTTCLSFPNASRRCANSTIQNQHGPTGTIQHDTTSNSKKILNTGRAPSPHCFSSQFVLASCGPSLPPWGPASVLDDQRTERASRGGRLHVPRFVASHTAFPTATRYQAQRCTSTQSAQRTMLAQRK